MGSFHDDAQDLVLPHRLDFEPVIILGLTKSELLMVTGIAAIVCLPVGLVVGLVFGKWTMGLPMGFLATFVAVMMAGVVLAKVKRQRPAGYYQQQLKIALHDFGFRQSRLIRRDGLWAVRRHR